MRREVRADLCWPSEREVAAEVPIEVAADRACSVLDSVPFWFHTFALNRGLGLYTPGAARDHGYRLGSIPDSFDGLRVLDVGAFDGFYSFLAEARGATRVLAIDNEQYVHWVRDRWGVELEGGEGFRAIHGLLGSEVEYRRTDVFALGPMGECFDFIFCFGILHRVEAPLTLLRVLAACLAPGGRIILETYGVTGGQDAPWVLVHEQGDVYARDEDVYWGFSRASLDSLGRIAGLRGFELLDAPAIAGHPRIIGTLQRS